MSITSSEMENYSKEMLFLRKLKKEIEERLKIMRPAMREYIIENGGECSTDSFKVSLVDKKKITFDFDKMKKLLLEDYGHEENDLKSEKVTPTIVIIDKDIEQKIEKVMMQKAKDVLK